MIQENAFVPKLLIRRGDMALENLISVFVGVVLLSLLAQIAIPLPGTPVPLTGQTFGVILTSLIWGKKRGLAVVASYFFVGAIGFPIFALGKAGISLGPTFGYLIGMIVASYFMGLLSDRNWTKTFISTLGVSILGSLIIYVFGLLGLSFFVSWKNAFNMGVLPFLPGDLIKSLVASGMVFQFNRKLI